MHDAQDALEIVTLVISCLFMGELLANFWGFGLRYEDSALATRWTQAHSEQLSQILVPLS